MCIVLMKRVYKKKQYLDYWFIDINSTDVASNDNCCLIYILDLDKKGGTTILD